MANHLRPGSYGATAKFFHWAIFLLLAAQYAVGSIMPHIGRKTLDEGWVNWHLSLSALILAVIVARFIWRLFHHVALPGDMPDWEIALSRVAHLTLYALVFAMTVLGWAAANSRGWTVYIAGLVPLPDIAPKGSAWGHEAGDIHNILVYVLLGFIALHVAGAAWHYFILRDKVVQRMGMAPRAELLRLAALLPLLLSGPAFALTDEIQVYTGDVAAPGVFNLTWHNNYTPDGLKTPDFPAGLTDNHSWSGVTEWAYGVTPWFEAGLYLPLYADSSTRGPQINGFKLRTLFVNPDNATSNFYYGVNFEFSYNARHWDEDRYTGEIRPILGWRGEGWSFTFNPILDNSYKGFSRLDFAPATRLDFEVVKGWTVAAEEYDDFGALRSFLPADQQSHQLFAVVDHDVGPVSVEFGAGFGLTPATDKLTFKLILSSDLNGPNGFFTR